MPEGRMPEIVRQCDRFREVLVQRQRARNRAADRGHLNRMRQPRAEMIAGAIEENLRIIFQAPKRARNARVIRRCALQV